MGNMRWRWPCSRFARWLKEGFTINSGGVFTVIQSMQSGTCLISKRCSTTKPNWHQLTWTLTKSPTIHFSLPPPETGRSSYEAKIAIGHQLVPLNNYCRHRNIFLHNVYRIFAQTIHWASMDEALARFLKPHPVSPH